MEAQQTLPVVADSYGRKHVAALEGEGDTPDAPDCSDLLDGMDLATLDEAAFGGPYAKVPFIFAAMNNTTQVAEINLQPSQAKDYSAYVPIQLGNLTTAAFIDSGNTFANVISPQTMTALGISIANWSPYPNSLWAQPLLGRG